MKGRTTFESLIGIGLLGLLLYWGYLGWQRLHDAERFYEDSQCRVIAKRKAKRLPSGALMESAKVIFDCGGILYALDDTRP